jgi:hypothetical protein
VPTMFVSPISRDFRRRTLAWCGGLGFSGFSTRARRKAVHRHVGPSHVGAGGSLGRSSRIRCRISANSSLGTATSAIWNVTYRAWVTIFAPILTSFSLRLVSDQCLTLFRQGGRLEAVCRADLDCSFRSHCREAESIHSSRDRGVALGHRARRLCADAGWTRTGPRRLTLPPVGFVTARTWRQRP